MASKQLQLVLVTPEVTLLDEPVESLKFPLYDGQIGILPGRAPLVGRLGTGELVLETASGKRSYFIDGGFVQIKGQVVSLLTNGATPAKSLDPKVAEDELQSVLRRHPQTDAEFVAKDVDQFRARQKLAVARKAH